MAEMGRDVAVVLIAWNSAGYLPRCLESLAAQRIDGGAIRLIAIDNASTDSSARLLEDAHPERLIRNRTNLGFAVAANQGIAASSSDYVLFLNPDVRLHERYIENCVKALEAGGERFGSATGTLYRASGFEMTPLPELDSRGIRMTRSGRHLDITTPSPERARSWEEIFGVSGAAAIFRRSCLEDVAIEGEAFDEAFFAYREDADLAWRARLFGWRSLWAAEAIGWHVRRVTPEVRGELPPEINMHSVKNRFLLRLKNQGPLLALAHAPWELPRDLAVLAATLTIERTSLPAWRWLWQHRAEIARRRARIQSRRRVSDTELARWFD
jgi:GT2 family glycosyltransferase